MKRPLHLDSKTVADFQSLTGTGNKRVLNHLIENLPVREASQSLDPKFYSALSDFIVDVEDSKFNGMNPVKNRDDRSRLLEEWRAYTLGNRSNINLKDSAKSDLALKIEEAEEVPKVNGLPVNEAVERAGNWLADSYTARGRAKPETAYISREDAIFQDHLGLREDSVLRMFSLGSPNETDRLQAGVGLLASEADRAEIIYPFKRGENNFRWGLSEQIEQDEAKDMLGADIDSLLEDTTESMKNSLERVSDLLEDETGLKREGIDPREYIQMVYRSDLDSVELDPDIVQNSIKKAVAEAGSDNATGINESSAKKVSNNTGVIKPHGVDPVSFMDAVSESESLTDVNVEDAVRRAVLGVERTKDELGLRKYRSGDKEAYSVTTIIDPFPNDYDEWSRQERLDFPYYREIDTGGGLFHWKNIYDGENGRYDADIVRDYAGLRGTLAHERVFEEYVDDPEEVRGDTHKYEQELEDMKAEKGDLGPLQDIVDWKEEKEFDVLEYDESGTGIARNGRELAEKEIDWIKDQFGQLEDELGLKKENVIAAEQEFVHSTMHPWDETAKIKGPEIGELTYGGTVDLLYEHESGETWLLDLKTGSMKPNYAIQQAAYKEAVENSEFFDVDEVDRVVIPSIDPETMMYSDKEPVIYTDRPHGNEKFNHSKFLDASNIDLESSNYRKNQWRPGNWDEEAFYIFARAAEEMDEAQPDSAGM